jgi:hypothetical protein
MSNSNNGIQWKNIIILITILTLGFFGFKSLKYFRDKTLVNEKLMAEETAKISQAKLTEFKQHYEKLQLKVQQLENQEIEVYTDSITALNLKVSELETLVGTSPEINEIDENTNYWYVSFENKENFGYAVLKLSQNSWDVIEANDIIKKQYKIDKFWYTAILPTSEYAYHKFIANSK